MIKVDVILQVYGKPWQTLCTLKSLLLYSHNYIDKIYLIEEAKHPFNDTIDEIFKHNLPIIHKKYDKWINIYGTWAKDVPVENIRHQWGIESSNKKHVFITHNDVLYTGDVIGEMLDEIGECVGIGEIGQCWNCPAKATGICSGETWNQWAPSYDDILSLPLPHIRTRKEDIDRDNPKLMPECRLNEWACLINREVCIKEGRPYFGEFNHDSGTEWFKSMYRKGYDFKDYRRNFEHGYFTPDRSGYNAEQVEQKYRKSEELAKQYFKENYEIND